MRRTSSIRSGNTLRLLASLLASLALGTAANAQIGAVYATPQTGVIGDHAIALSGMSPPFVRTCTFSNSDFQGAPIGVQDCLIYSAHDNWEAAFTPAIRGLLWYGQLTRGLSGSIGGVPTDYTFSHPFTILSGYSGATVVGNTLSLPTGSFHSGVLHFAGEISTLTCTTTCTEPNRQNCTFGQLKMPLGSAYCAPAVANSSGAPASITAVGSDFVEDNLVTLEVTSMPSNSTGMFLTSQTQGFVAMPGGSLGNLCLGGGIGRFQRPGQVQSSTAMGTLDLALDLTRQPSPMGLTSVVAGETWNYQIWFRDVVGGMAVSNFSDGVEVEFR